jgi:PAS domain S-box-containing protein
MNRAVLDSVQARLARLILIAVLLAMVVTVGTLVLFEVTTFRPRVLENAKTQADLIAEIIVPALEFSDPATAEKLLSVLRHESMVEAAAIYQADGTLLARYQRPQTQVVPPAGPVDLGDRLVGNKAIVSVQVKSEGLTIGQVWLQADTPGWKARFQPYALLLTVVALVVVGLSVFIAVTARRQITGPLQALAETVRRIGSSRDLGLRVPENDRGEVGDLGRSFNALLDTINQRDRLMSERDTRLVRHNAGLARLAHLDLDDVTHYGTVLKEVTELVAESQQVDRVGVWLFEDARSALVCGDLFVQSAHHHEHGQRLTRAEFPHYFQAIESDRTIAAADAVHHPETREFAGNYLRPLGIGAMLDSPIRWRGQVIGVLCHEHVGGVREWHSDEITLSEVCAERVTHLLERRESMLAEAARRESDTRFRDFISQAQDAIFTLTLDGRIQSVNDAARRITGWELNTWIGHRFQRVLLPEDVALAEQRFAEVVKGGVPPSFELRIRTRQGGLATLEFVVSPQREGGKVVGLLGIGRDVTERKQAAETRSRLEEQLRHSQKMEAIGTMAGGIAHDFNNLLTAIIGNAQLAELDLRQADPVREYLMQVLIASHRAKELVQQILAFSRRQEQVLAPVSLDKVVSESLKLLRPVIASTIRIEAKLPPGLPPVSGDATQLQQVVVNLATNAAHAMEDKGGLLELVLEQVEVNLEMCRLQPELKPGHYVRLSVTDNGIGMSAAVLEKIFDPFFTTKDKGKGTGLGLAVVHGIVQQHGGMISVSSVLGEGTTFRVYCPSASGTPLAAAPSAALQFAGAGEPVLVIDDEEQVLRVAVSVLQRNGYHPVAYHDPLRALAAFSERPDHWRLVVTDQLMPSIKGTALAAEIWKLRPGFPVILATGFSGNLDENVIRGVGFAGILAKPYTKESLLAQVGQALQRQA